MVGVVECPCAGHRTKSRLPDDMLEKCVKNRNGTCFACQKLISIDRKIEDAHKTLARLLDEREAMASVLNDHHDPFASRIPVEVVSHIFVLCRPALSSDPTIDERYDDKELIKAVFSTSRISRNWRTIAQNTPKLWTVLCAKLTDTNCIPSATIVNHWLERSGRLPLYIQIQVMMLSDDQAARKVIRSVIVHAERCKVLDLWTPYSFRTLISTALSTKRLERLEHLKLGLAGFGGLGGETLQVNAAPRYLTLPSSSLHLLLSSGMTWERLTHANVGCTSARDIMQLFRLASSLSFCKITLGDTDIGSTSLCVPENCPSLHHLIIQFPNTSFWDYYTFPSLDILELKSRCHEGGDSECWTPLQSFLRRSSCKLNELVIEDDDTCDCQSRLAEVLNLTPKLEKLTLDGQMFYNSEALFASMDAAVVPSTSVIQPTPGILTNLSSLVCRTEDLSFDWSLLIGFLTTMISTSKPSLRSFAFEYLTECPDGECASLMDKRILKQVLQAVDGLEFSVKDEDGRDILEVLRRLHELE